jgi:thiol-disulfide isomerase/thioredoxin
MTTIDVTYVSAEHCHFCERGRAVLAGLADRYPMRVREVALTSEEGRQIAARWRVPYPPVLLVDGRLAGYGRLSARALERALADRRPAHREVEA